MPPFVGVAPPSARGPVMQFASTCTRYHPLREENP